jgi:hypothetical protein
LSGPPSLIDAVIRSSRRRSVLVAAVEHLAFAMGAFLASTALLLILGTQIFEWYWLVLISVIGIAVAGWRLRRAVFDRYRIAQLVDKRLQLNDSLSTACFLLLAPDWHEKPAARYQIAYAGELVSRVEVRRAFPYGGQRAWAATAILAVTVFSLFALRYYVKSSLNLRPSLLPLQFSSALERWTTFERGERSGSTSSADHGLAGALGERGAREASAGREVQPSAHIPQAVETSGAATGSGTQQAGNDESGDEQARDGKADSRSAGDQNGPQSGSKETSDADQQQNGDQSQTSSLMSRMRDALSSLVAKMRQNTAAQSQARDSQNAPSDQKERGQAAPPNDESAGSQSAKDQAGREGSEQQAQEAKAIETPQSSQGGTADEAAQNDGHDRQSGAGHQEGQKQLKEAEQLKAMGKLAEIIGKRSANLTGDISVETPSTQQQLQTQYSNHVAHHTDSGGQIHRDEIPPEYEQYVRDYMERVHKEAESK